jgi:aminoglycoside phosphotransferase (APT) family kinase protein
VDAAEASRALAAAGFPAERVERSPEQGWASWTYVVDDRYVVRFPRSAEIVEAMHREMRLLPALAEHVSFRVPEPVFCADDWFVYELIPGRGFEVGDDVRSARAAIGELHSFPVDVARSLLGRPSWSAQWAMTRRLFEEVAFPHLPADVLEQVLESWELPPPEQETFVHDDLGLEHLLVDDRGHVVGIIDFEDANVGDPEIDLVPLAFAVGLPVTRRMWRYRWNGSLHAIVHHVWEDEPAEVEAAVDELRRRVALRHP